VPGSIRYGYLLHLQACCLTARLQLEHGFSIWDFRGQELEKCIVDRFKQFLWRPRPHTLLTKEQQQLALKSFCEYGRQFDVEDAMLQSNVSAELIALRKRLVDEWNVWRTQCREEVDRKESHKRLDLEAESQEAVEVWFEELGGRIRRVNVTARN
jgi:translation initiation factor 3 subunit B